MSIVNFANLDFDQIKESIKNYIRSNSNFTDFDFEGSNLSIIIDILAYNTYIQSYNANMISNEVFLEGATLRDNVVAHAQNIGYTPRSRKASSSNVSFFVDTSNLTQTPLALTLQKGIVCSSINVEGSNYTFVIPQDITKVVEDNMALFDNITIYEGTLIGEKFSVNTKNKFQRFILGNSNLDTDLIEVFVNDVKYTQVNSIIELNSTSTIYFIREIEDQRYEILFGDGIFGRNLEQNDLITVSYIVSNGESANGISNFNFQGVLKIAGTDSTITSGVSNISGSSSFNGKEVESVDSIKRYAPLYHATQNRAVTSFDYETIIPKIYTQTESVHVFGGEDLEPPQYGKVFITIKPLNGSFISNTIKDNIKRELKKYKVSGILPVILDLKYLYVEVYSGVYVTSYNSEIRNLILKNIQQYSLSKELNQYNSRFRYSKFLKLIDDSSSSVVSNITQIQMRRDLQPTLNSYTQYEICFGNKIHISNSNGYNIRTSGFKVFGYSEVLYLSDIPSKTKGLGDLFLFYPKSSTEPVIVKKSVGTIDYNRGEILISGINIISTVKSKNGQDIIEISAVPESNDVVGQKDLYLQLDYSKTQIDLITDSSISYSSYFNQDLIR